MTDRLSAIVLMSMSWESYVGILRVGCWVLGVVCCVSGVVCWGFEGRMLGLGGHMWDFILRFGGCMFGIWGTHVQVLFIEK